MDRCVISKHETADTMSCLQIRAATRKSDLNGGRPPGNKLSEIPLTDALQTLMNLNEIKAAE